jgi:Carboxypeptidase regulatory-like domain
MKSLYLESRMINNKIIIAISLVLALGIGSAAFMWNTNNGSQSNFPTVAPRQLWRYQCIDTMKSSRDRAREWMKRADLAEEIARQMKAVSSMGANCVSIGTPYDSEFNPYLRAWVEGARAEGLSIWFRGNFAGWEGWFDYPRITDEKEHHTKMVQFISDHPDLFADGDIFTGAPEAENGGPFLPGHADQYERYRLFLSETYALCQNTFFKINKKISCNWFSMSGGHAKSIFNEPSIASLNRVVTIDHYMRDSRDMGEYIDYFVKKYNARLVIGEYGAPIPDLNGKMTPEEQATFVRHTFIEMYTRRAAIEGINYWTLLDSSTQLLNDDYSERAVVEVVKDFYIPGVLVGRVVNSNGKGVAEAAVRIDSEKSDIYTNDQGYFSIDLPAGEYSVSASYEDVVIPSQEVTISRATSSKLTLVAPKKK